MAHPHISHIVLDPHGGDSVTVDIVLTVGGYGGADGGGVIAITTHGDGVVRAHEVGRTRRLFSPDGTIDIEGLSLHQQAGELWELGQQFAKYLIADLDTRHKQGPP